MSQPRHRKDVRGRPKGSSGSTRAECVRLFAEGLPPVDIAPRLGITIQAATHHLRRAGYDPAARASERRAGERERFRKVWQSSRSVAEAARALGLTRARALLRAEWLRSRGLKLKLLGVQDRVAGKLARQKRIVAAWNAAPTPAEAARLLGWGVEFTRSLASRLRRLGLPVKYVRKPPPPHKRAYRPRPNGKASRGRKAVPPPSRCPSG
jgi:hypothetical protein